MKLVRIFLTFIALLSISASSPEQESVEDQGVNAGFTVATTGLNGWYTSNLTVYAVSPVLANGKLLHPGESITVSDEGAQSIEFASPDGTSTATQLAQIDKTLPTVTWNSVHNAEVMAKSSGLSAEIADAGSGVCLVQLSTDNGRSWIEGWNAAGFNLAESIKETTWTYHDGFPEFAPGSHVVILRAQDCAGNFSVGEILIVRIK